MTLDWAGAREKFSDLSQLTLRQANTKHALNARSLHYDAQILMNSMNSRFSLFLICGALAPLSALHAQNLAGQFPVKSGTAKPAKPAGPSQSKVAAKGAFPTVKAAAIKGAKPATDLAGAKKLVGKTATFVGTVDKVFETKSHGVVLLNFAKNYKSALIGAVDAKHFAAFPDLAQLKGKKITVTGKVVIFNGAPEVELEKAGAIKIVK